MVEREGFEPSVRYRTPAFQAFPSEQIKPL